MKLIKIRDAAEMLGVSHQTLVNWSKNGTLKLHKMSADGGSTTYYLDADTLLAIGDSIADVEHAKQQLKKERAEIRKLQFEAQEICRIHEHELFVLNKYTGKRQYLMEFYVSIPKALQSIGVLSVAESKIMQRLIEGDTASLVAEEYMMSPQRIIQIFHRGCRRAARMTGIKEKLDDNETLLKENENLKRVIENMKSELDTLRSKVMDFDQQAVKKQAEREQFLKDYGDKIALLNKNISELNLPIRLLNCLNGYDEINTLADLCKLGKNYLLRFRNIGRKTVFETEEFLWSHGLSFGLNVDELYQLQLEKQINDKQAEEFS